MGRFATSVAASATNADNLPVMLPKVSLLDALLPRSLTTSGASRRASNASRRPLDSNASAPASATGYSEIKKDKKGRLVMVQHKGSSVSGEPITLEDVKKDKKGEANGNGKKDESKDEKKDGGEAKEVEFTAEEDAKLKELKASQTSWKEIAATMNRNQGDLKKRWKEIEGTAGGETAKTENKKKQGAFSAAEDAKLKELKALKGKESKSWNVIAEEMGRDVEELKEHWKEINPNGQNNANDSKSGDAPKEKGGKGEGGKQQKMDHFVFTAEQDQVLRDLMKSGATVKTCARQLKKPQDAIEKRWEEIGGAGEKKDDAPKAGSAKSDSGKKAKEETASKAKEEEKKKAPSSASKNKESSSKKAPSVARSTRSTRSQVRFTIQEWMTLQEDEFFTFEELQLLCRIINKSPEQSWLSTACKFYDETGRRVHPDDIREKFEAMARMG